MNRLFFLFIISFLPVLLYSENMTKCSEKNYFSFQDKTNYTIKSLQKIINKNPSDIRCAIDLINLYLKNGNVSKGFKLLVETYNKYPKKVQKFKIYKIIKIAKYMTTLREKAKSNHDINDWNKLAFGYYKMGVFKEAIKAYRQSISINPKQIEPRIRLSLALLKTGRKYMAIEELQNVIKLDKNNFFAYYYAGKILKYNIKDVKKANIYFQKAKQLCTLKKLNMNEKLYKLFKQDLDNETKK